MSRKHLYKAKRVNWRELPKEEWWVEGNLLISDDDYYIIPDFGVSCLENLNNYVCDNLITLHAFEVDKETVCEYTGLTDKNGRKIFEGDILFVVERMGNDVYQNGILISRPRWVNETKFKVEFTPGGLANTQRFSNSKKIECKVIGNIFDNSELLKENATECV